MFYIAHVCKEGKRWLAEFPDAPGCQTFADSKEDLRAAAKEALEGWLEAHLVGGQVPGRPQVRVAAPKSHELWKVHVEPGLSVAVQLRWVRQDLGLTQKELAKRAGVSQQQIAKLENPDENPTIRTLSKVSEALRGHGGRVVRERGLSSIRCYRPFEDPKSPPGPGPLPRDRVAQARRSLRSTLGAACFPDARM